MAGVLERALDSKYYNYSTELVDETERARIEARDKFREDYEREVSEHVMKGAPREREILKRLIFEKGCLKRAYPYPNPERFFPTKVRFTKGDHCWDYCFIAGGPSVSKRLRDLIEEIEPNVHQFVPVDIYHKDGTFYQTFYYWHIPTAIDAINPELGGGRNCYGPC